MTTAWNAQALNTPRHIDRQRIDRLPIRDHGPGRNETVILVVAAAGWLAMATIAALLFTGIWTPDAPAPTEQAPAPEQQSDRTGDQAVERTIVPRPRVPQPQTPAPHRPTPRAPQPRAPQTGS